MHAERVRLEETARRQRHWRRWGPYLSERQWGTVREDYSPDGKAWEYLPFEHARSRAYRWGEDGLLGWCDNRQRLCFAVALWNGQDRILKERLFGLNGPEGNHGEDVKELYYYLDSTPTHSYAKALYKYPQIAFPYDQLRAESRRRTRLEPEFELIETGILDDDRYFDVLAEYAKADVDDLLIRLTVTNRGPRPATLHVLPTLWFRNTWSWRVGAPRPALRLDGPGRVNVVEDSLGQFEWLLDDPVDLLFTENDTNKQRLYGVSNPSPYVKDAFHDFVVQGQAGSVNPAQVGTKCAALYRLRLGPGEEQVLRLRLRWATDARPDPWGDFNTAFTTRLQEADEFYADLQKPDLSADACNVQRQAFAGLLWTKQYYHFVVEDWLRGDPASPPPPRGHAEVRNHDWPHLFNEDVVSMPDKWEYPWYAAWDTAFHMIPFALVDAEYAKSQLGLFLREWYMHPNGQLPAYEWNFSDVNPPVHAWACWRVYKIDEKEHGCPDMNFLESVFHKLLMNFTWWVNRKDREGNNIFEGGFLGLDNIGVFDRSKPLPFGGQLEQSDATSWMAMYCLDMLRIALELALVDRNYEDIASKFFEHFLYISRAINRFDGRGLWDEEDGFFYDRVRLTDGRSFAMQVRSVVGLIPLFAVDTLEASALERLPGFRKRCDWFVRNRPDLIANTAILTPNGQEERRLLSILSGRRLARVLGRMFDEDEFLSPYGIRSLSKAHQRQPYVLRTNGTEHRVDYEPAESRTPLFGGNSNWRGPVWFPINYLIIESLQRYHHFLGDDVTFEFPTGSGQRLHLGAIAAELSRRLSRLFLRDEEGRRAIHGDIEKFQSDPHFRDHLLFHEYFHADHGQGLGAMHQTGWTGLVAKLLQQSGE